MSRRSEREREREAGDNRARAAMRIKRARKRERERKGPDNKVKWGTMSRGVSTLNAMIVSCSHGPMPLYRSCRMVWPTVCPSTMSLIQ